MKKTKRMALLAAVAAAGAWAQTSTTSTSTRDIAIAGLGANETAQLFVVNTATASGGGTAASCTGSLSYTNAAGTAIGTAVTFALGTGQSSSASLPYSQAGQSGRAIVRAHLTLTRAGGSNAPCSLKTLFETFDTTTGATHVHVDGGQQTLGGGFRD